MNKVKTIRRAMKKVNSPKKLRHFRKQIVAIREVEWNNKVKKADENLTWGLFRF